ncbi:arrestin domain-containing protein 3 [Biomphalaria glabrata]
MGKIKECKITRDRDVYRPGENISGQVTLVVEGDVKARSVNIFCCGMALTKWRGAFQRSYESDNCSKEIYVNLVIRKAVQNLTSGNHQYVYNFNLPSQGLPSSFEGHYGSIRYFLRVEVDKPFPSINNHFYSSFTVLAHLDANLPVYKKVASASVKKQLSKVLGLGNAGNLYLSASIDRNGYCPGEVILINMEARNESSKDCGAVKASLVQYVHYKASSYTNRETNVIRTLLDQKLEKGQNRIWHQQRLPIDPVPPSLKQLTCQIIKVTYSLNIEIEVPLGIDLALSFPLKICTVPLGKHVEEKPVPVKPGVLEIPGSKSVKYVQCTAGYKVN